MRKSNDNTRTYTCLRKSNELRNLSDARAYRYILERETLSPSKNNNNIFCHRQIVVELYFLDFLTWTSSCSKDLLSAVKNACVYRCLVVDRFVLPWQWFGVGIKSVDFHLSLATNTAFAWTQLVNDGINTKCVLYANETFHFDKSAE